MRLEDFLESTATKQTFARGKKIVSAGEQAEAAYWIIKGQVEVFKKLEDGHEAVIARIGAGEIFGEMALLRYDTYTLSARALEDVSVYVISPKMLHDQVRQAHPLLRALIDTLVERVHTANEVLIDLDSAG